MAWTWDPAKAASNLKKHKVSFALAERALEDSGSATRPDPYPGEERWQTLGKPSDASPVVLFVVHRWPLGDDRLGRIISARKATPQERKQYEEGQI